MSSTILIVDDSKLVTDIVKMRLEMYGYEVSVAHCGEDGLSRVVDVAPDLIVLDVQMPGVDGIEVFRTMRADPDMQDIPVIFFTANAEKLKQRLPEVEGLGAALLPKPFNVIRLLDMVEAALAS